MNKFDIVSRDDFKPEIHPSKVKPFFKWDGIMYYGECYVNDRRCYFVWIEDICESVGEYMKFAFHYNSQHYIYVEREKNGVHVFGAYYMTDEQISHIDKWYEVYHSCKNEKARIEAFNAAGLERYNISGDLFLDVRKQELAGYWFENGLEDHNDIYYHGLVEDIKNLPQEKQDFINSLEELEDEQ